MVAASLVMLREAPGRAPRRERSFPRDLRWRSSAPRGTVGLCAHLLLVRAQVRGTVPENPQHGCHQPRSSRAVAAAEEIDMVDRCQRATASQLGVWYLTIIEPDRNKPRVVRATQS